MSWAGPHQYPIGKNSSRVSVNPEFTAFDPSRPTLVCLSHLRWSFVYQRPQHLMARGTRDYNVLFWEEPIIDDSPQPWLEKRHEEEGVWVLVPRLPRAFEERSTEEVQRRLLDDQLAQLNIDQLVLWYYTPMSISFSDHLGRQLTVYDCMDELSAFRGAPPELLGREQKLLARADLVFTGGYSLYDAKRDRHPSVHPFPSSVEVGHFAAARAPLPEPCDQRAIPGPRLGFYGVIDERLDLELIAGIADARSDWQVVLVGPVVKIGPGTLPERPNIHYLGGKPYDELPNYLAGWDVALMPFALNESTRFISPTKTPEYLAGGRPVVSSPIVDVVRSYGDTRIVRIAHTVQEWVEAIDGALVDAGDQQTLLALADEVLNDMSWDDTWNLMQEKMECVTKAAVTANHDWLRRSGSRQQVPSSIHHNGEASTTSSLVPDLREVFSPNVSPRA